LLNGAWVAESFRTLEAPNCHPEVFKSLTGGRGEAGVDSGCSKKTASEAERGLSVSAMTPRFELDLEQFRLAYSRRSKHFRPNHRKKPQSAARGAIA